MCGGEIRRQGEAARLDHVHARADHQEGKGGRDGTEPFGAVRAVRQDDQRERHEREAAVLEHRAGHEVGHAAPADDRDVGIGTVADEGAGWR